MSESGSRYERSFPGMVGAMIVTLIAIGAFVVFRDFHRDDLEVEREGIDYLPQVADVQSGAPFPIAYPPGLPDDWRVTAVGFDDEVGLTWSIDLITDDDQYVAIRQAEAEIDTLLDTYVDEQRIPGDEVRLGGPISGVWESASDTGGDNAMVIQVGKTSLLVFGTASDDEMSDFAASLTTSRVR